MPPSAIDSSDIFLQLLWQASLSLAILSFVILAIVIIRRSISNWRHRKDENFIAEYKKYFYIALSMQKEWDPYALPELKPYTASLITRIAVDILRNLKGSDKDKIVTLLKAWNIKPHLKNMVENGRKGQKIQALTLFGLFDDDESLEILLKFSHSNQTYVQLAALRGLSERTDKAYIGNVINELGKTKLTNRLIMADILSRFGYKAVPALIDLGKKDKPQNIRIASIIALGAIGSLDAVEHLKDLLRDKSPEIQAESADALGKIGDISAGDALADAIRNEHSFVRTKAAIALGLLRFDKAIGALADSLYDDNWWVRFHAAEALYNLGQNGLTILRTTTEDTGKAGLIARQVLAERTNP